MGQVRVLQYIYCIFILIVIGPAVLYDAYFSETDGPMLMDHVHCNGWENSIFDCENQIYPNIGGCAPQWSMGVICKDGKHGRIVVSSLN